MAPSIVPPVRGMPTQDPASPVAATGRRGRHTPRQNAESGRRVSGGSPPKLRNRSALEVQSLSSHDMARQIQRYALHEEGLCPGTGGGHYACVLSEVFRLVQEEPNPCLIVVGPCEAEFPEDLELDYVDGGQLCDLVRKAGLTVFDDKFREQFHYFWSQHSGEDDHVGFLVSHADGSVMRSAMVFKCREQKTHYLPIEGGKRHTVGTDLAEYYRRRAEVSDTCSAGVVFVRSEAGIAIFPAAAAYRGHCWRVGGDAEVVAAAGALSSPKRARVPHRLSGAGCGGCGSAASLMGNEDTIRLETVIRKVLREDRAELVEDIKAELIHFLHQSNAAGVGPTCLNLDTPYNLNQDPDTTRRSDVLQHSADTFDSDMLTARAEIQPTIVHSMTGLNCQYAPSPSQMTPLAESEQDATPRATAKSLPVSPVVLDCGPPTQEPAAALPSPLFTPSSSLGLLPALTPPVPSRQDAEPETPPPAPETAASLAHMVSPRQASALETVALISSPPSAANSTWTAAGAALEPMTPPALEPQGPVPHAHYCEVSPQALISDNSASLSLMAPVGQSPQPANNSVSVIVGAGPLPPPSFVPQRPATVTGILRQATPTGPVAPEASWQQAPATPATTPHRLRPPTAQQLYGY